MFWLFLACTAGGPGGPTPDECETVYQTADDESSGASGYEYCAEEDDGNGAFNRVSDEECADGGFCTTDADCDNDEVCLCAGGVSYDGGTREMTALSQCVDAHCRTDDDCDGYACGLTFDICGGPQALFCRTAQDSCHTDADCPSSQFCFYTGAKWACQDRGTCD